MVDHKKSTQASAGEPALAYLTEKEVAARLNISVKVLQKARVHGGGIPYAKFFGTMVRYPLSEIEQFEARALRSSTSDQGVSRAPASQCSIHP